MAHGCIQMSGGSRHLHAIHNGERIGCKDPALAEEQPLNELSHHQPKASRGNRHTCQPVDSLAKPVKVINLVIGSDPAFQRSKYEARTLPLSPTKPSATVHWVH